MSKKKKRRGEKNEELSVSPEARVAEKFDGVGVAKFRVAPRDRMGVRVVDDCAEEHIM